MGNKFGCFEKLEVFHLRYTRRNLGISWDNVRDSNVQVRKRFNNIKSVELQIAKRRLAFLGKIIRITNDKIPARLLSAVCQGKRPLGRPNTMTRHSMLKDIEKIIPEVDNTGSFSSWAYIANDKLAWSILINNLGSNNFKPTPDWDGKIPESPKSPFLITFSENKTPRTPPQVPSSPPIPSPSPPPLPPSPLLRPLFKRIVLG